jgi:hypothetical protein
MKNISKTALKIWKNLGGGKNSSDLLLTQIGLYRNKDEPFDYPYVENVSTPINWWSSVELKKGEDCIRKLAFKIHAIIPHNATCERVFSILGWYLGKRRTK